MSASNGIIQGQRGAASLALVPGFEMADSQGRTEARKAESRAAG